MRFQCKKKNWIRFFFITVIVVGLVLLNLVHNRAPHSGRQTTYKRLETYTYLYKYIYIYIHVITRAYNNWIVLLHCMPCGTLYEHQHHIMHVKYTYMYRYIHMLYINIFYMPFFTRFTAFKSAISFHRVLRISWAIIYRYIVSWFIMAQYCCCLFLFVAIGILELAQFLQWWENASLPLLYTFDLLKMGDLEQH